MMESLLPLGEILPPWSVIPFAGILLSIALCEFIAPNFWHHHFGKVSAGWALIFAVPFLMAYGATALHEILHIYVADYIPFVIVLWGLYAVCGGIVVHGSFSGTPQNNTLVLGIGTVLASFMGTTGASMILIRPLLRANAFRKSKTPLVLFFIFLIGNVGGALTPLGDPPLFLGFLHGVPFFWTFRLLPHMALVSLFLLTLFFIIDTGLYKKEGHEDAKSLAQKAKKRLRLEGKINILFLGGIIGAILLSGFWQSNIAVNIVGVSLGLQDLVRDLVIFWMGILSLKYTKSSVREANRFSWVPVIQVATLFAGIFMTIIPALLILKAGAKGAFSFILHQVNSAATYFWITGFFSSFLDNAPTYLTFFTSALGALGWDETVIGPVLRLSSDPFRTLTDAGRFMDPQLQGLFVERLLAISAGAVFMGSLTYIGNAPNLLVKEIAKDHHIRMPSFFGYMAYSVPILIPIFILLQMLFF